MPLTISLRTFPEELQEWFCLRRGRPSDQPVREVAQSASFLPENYHRLRK